MFSFWRLIRKIKVDDIFIYGKCCLLRQENQEQIMIIEFVSNCNMISARDEKNVHICAYLRLKFAMNTERIV
jgi:hypothetical protein